VGPDTGVLSEVNPLYDNDIHIVDDSGRDDVPVGDVGALVTTRPQAVLGCWPTAAEDEEVSGTITFPTSDVGCMDRDRWFYVLDRKNDVINTWGYKVWPREVEEVLMTHPM